MIRKQPDPRFSQVDYSSAYKGGIAGLILLKDANGEPIFEKVTPETYPELHKNNVEISRVLGIEPKDLYCCRDFSFCPNGAAHYNLNAIMLNKELISRLTPDEQKSLLGHERQHFEQKRNYQTIRENLWETVGEFFHNFGPMIPSLSSVGMAAFSFAIKLAADLPMYVAILENSKISRENEYDADAAAVKVAGALATLSYGRKLLIYTIEEGLEDGFAKSYLLDKATNMKVSDLGWLQKISSGFGLVDLLLSHPSPILRGRQIASLEGKTLEELVPLIPQLQQDNERLKPPTSTIPDGR